jgi:flagellar motor switch/type III secretory pathway protein FliN
MIDDACVQLVVSFPAVSIPVGDANALRAGQVVDLGVSLAEASLTVKVSGEDIGEGRLLVVGTHAGVLLVPMRN